MTCIAVVRGPDGVVWMGADSCLQRSGTLLPMAQPKVFALGDVWIGRMGYDWHGRVLRAGFNPGKVPDAESVHDWLVTSFVPRARKYLIDADAWDSTVDEEGHVAGTRGGWMLVARGRIFELAYGLEVSETALPYHAIGNGEDVALGALAALCEIAPEMEPRAKLEIALRASALHRENVAPPFVYLPCTPSTEAPPCDTPAHAASVPLDSRDQEAATPPISTTTCAGGASNP